MPMEAFVELQLFLLSVVILQYCFQHNKMLLVLVYTSQCSGSFCLKKIIDLLGE